MVFRFLIGAVGLVLATGGSGAAGNVAAATFLKVRVESVEGLVSPSPIGELVDPQCPKNVCVFRYSVGTPVTLTASAGQGSSLHHWETLYSNRPNPCLGTDRVCRFVLDGVKATTAVFSPLRLTTFSNPGGGINVYGTYWRCGSGCYKFEYGARVELEASNEA